MKTIIVTERQADLIEVALDSAVSACAGLPGVDNSETDSLAGEYQGALEAVQRATDG